MQDSEGRDTAALVPAILKTRQLLKLGPMEPAWLGSCRVELDDWKSILAELDILATHIAALESHLEGVQKPTLTILCLYIRTWYTCMRACFNMHIEPGQLDWLHV